MTEGKYDSLQYSGEVHRVACIQAFEKLYRSNQNKVDLLPSLHRLLEHRVLSGFITPDIVGEESKTFQLWRDLKWRTISSETDGWIPCNPPKPSDLIFLLKKYYSPEENISITTIWVNSIYDLPEYFGN